MSDKRSAGAKWVCLLATFLLSTACGTEEEIPAGLEDCNGKCDGLSRSFKDLYSDMRKVDLGDLVSLGAKLAFDELNDRLSVVPYSNIELSPTELYGTSQQAQDDLTLNDLEKLSSSLVARYGDGDFISHVNQLRTAWLKSNPGQVFAEAQFAIGAQFRPQMGLQAGGVPFTVGLQADRGIKTTVIAPFKSEYRAHYQAPLAALMATRGYVLPSNVDQLMAMAPGESINLQSNGILALNVGMGLPIYLTTVADVTTLHAVISAGARVTLGGQQMDIQLVRDEGNKVVVDLGVVEPEVRSFNLGVKTRWGIEGLPEVNVDLGPLDLNLTDLAEKALEKLLNDKLSLASVSYARDSQQVRHTVARFSFDLNQRGEAIDQALIQALLGDIRLAQALAQRDGSGVTQPLDFTREARSLSNYFGAQFLSLKFYRQQQDREVSVVVTTGAQSQRLLFDELDQRSGFFFTDRGYRRRSIVSLKSENGQLTDADYNLHLQLGESDSYTSRNQIQDHVDPLLAAFIGRESLDTWIAPTTNALERFMEQHCVAPTSAPGGGDNNEEQLVKEQAYRECIASLASQPFVKQSLSQARTNFNFISATGLPDGMDPALDDAADFANKLFELKLAVQGSFEYPALLTGPESAMLVDLRLGSAAISELMANGERFHKSLKDVLYLMHLEREDKWQDQIEDTNEELEDLEGELRQAKSLFSTQANAFQKLQRLAQAAYVSKAMGAVSVGDHAHLAIVGEKGAVSMSSVAAQKAEVAAALFDQLVDQLDLDVTEHQAIGYALLGSVHPSQLELLISMKFKKDSYTNHPDLSLHGLGQQAKLIEAGRFSIDALIGN